ncbi:MAG TPA: PilW family protein [Burkholderiales bacterium]
MRASRYHFSERGFSMVELMVAMVIGLIGMIIIFQVFEVSEGIKRSTTSGGDAQQNGVIALYTMERDFKNAGMGFNDTAYAGCDIIGWDLKRTTQNFPPAGVTMKLAPVSITSGAASTTPDQISVLYGSQPQASGSVPLASDMAVGGNGADALNVTNPYGYTPGDLLLLGQINAVPAKKCSVMEYTSPGVTSNILNHVTTAYLSGAVSHTPRFNRPGGLGVEYNDVKNASSRVFNLGNLYYVPPGAPPSGTAPIDLPVYNFYAIANGSLTVASQFQIDSTGQPAVSSIADNIVHMRALYGLDDGNTDLTVPSNVVPVVAGDGIVDRYVDAATFNALAPVPWNRLIAVRIAIVSRSALPEKPSSGKLTDPCDATPVTAEPQWTGTPWAATFGYKTRLDVSASVAAPDSWTCYRYRVFETTIPLRNWIWKSS